MKDEGGYNQERASIHEQLSPKDFENLLVKFHQQCQPLAKNHQLPGEERSCKYYKISTIMEATRQKGTWTAKKYLATDA